MLASRAAFSSSMRTVFIAGVTLVLSATIISQTPPRSAAALAALGPQVGQRVPDFSLVDQRGERRTLESILGPNGAMLVFFRSADW